MSSVLTPAGERLVPHLRQKHSDLKVPVEEVLDDHLRGYYALVIDQRLYTPEEFFARFPSSATSLMSAFISDLPGDDPLKVEMSLTKLQPVAIQAQESIALNEPTVHQLQRLIEALVPGGSIADVRLIDLQGMVTMPGRLTAQWAHEHYRLGEHIASPAYARYVALCEVQHMRPAAFFGAFPQDARSLYLALIEQVHADANRLLNEDETTDWNRVTRDSTAALISLSEFVAH